MGEPADHLGSRRFDPPGAGQSASSPPDLDRSVSEAAERIEAIIDAATRVASEIRAGARAEAERYLDEAQRKADRVAMQRIGMMSELTESLTERAERVRQQSDELVRALEDAMRAVAATVGDSPEPRVEDAPATEPDGSRQQFVDRAPPPAVTLRAARMAVTGSSRDEIGAALSSEFGIEDPGPVLDRILGRDRA